MKSCVLCKEKIGITSSVCKDCKLIKAFINLYGKKTLLIMIKTSQCPTPSPTAPPTVPYYHFDKTNC